MGLEKFIVNEVRIPIKYLDTMIVNGIEKEPKHEMEMVTELTLG